MDAVEFNKDGSPRGAIQYKTASPGMAVLHNALNHMSKLFGEEPAEDQYRMDKQSGRYVQLLRSMWPDNEVPDDKEQLWWVEDILTGVRYWRNEFDLWDSPLASEMEVIAWAADQEDGDPDIAGD